MLSSKGFEVGKDGELGDRKCWGSGVGVVGWGGAEFSGLWFLEYVFFVKRFIGGG